MIKVLAWQQQSLVLTTCIHTRTCKITILCACHVSMTRYATGKKNGPQNLLLL